MLLLLLLAGLCALSFLLVREAAASEAAGTPPSTSPSLSVFLIIDHSNSMYDRGNGVGSDPDFLRIEAARLFISYLGVDAGPAQHQVGIINFGQEAHLLLPLTSLADETRRAEINRLLDDPPRLHWTDPNDALALAFDQLFGADVERSGRPAVILLTDGKPEWSNHPTDDEIDAYRVATLALAAQFTEREIPLFVILLANETTDSDPDIAVIWKPLWQEVTQAVPPGCFFKARHSSDLLPIYHDIAVALSGAQTEGAVIDETLSSGRPVTHTIAVESNLARVTLVVYASEPETEIQVYRPDHSLVRESDSGVVFAGGGENGTQQVWGINEPAAGPWRVAIQGEGRVVVWKDMRSRPATSTPSPTVKPTSTATATPTTAPTSTPLPIATPTPTATASPTPTTTPAPVIVPVDLPVALLQGTQKVLVVRLDHGRAGLRLSVQIEDPAGQVHTQRLLDDGREGDRQRGDGLYSTPFEAGIAGVYYLDFQVRDGDTDTAVSTCTDTTVSTCAVVGNWETRIAVERMPDWEILAPTEGDRLRAGNHIVVRGRWTVGDVPLNVDQLPGASVITLRGQGPQDIVLDAPLVLDSDGHYTAELLDLAEPGSYTLTIEARGQSPTGLPIEVARTVTVELYCPLPFWFWLMGGSVAIGATGGAGAMVLRRRRPKLTGWLRQVGGPPLDAGSPDLDLDDWGRDALRFGGPRADWALQPGVASFSLHVGEAVGETWRLYLRTDPGASTLFVDADLGGAIRELDEVMVDGQPVRGKVSLHDGSIVQTGPYRFRYENLLLPQAEQLEQIVGS